MTDPGSIEYVTIVFDAGDGPAVLGVEIDPPDDPDSVEIDLDEPAVSRANTPTMSRGLLASLIGHCR